MLLKFPFLWSNNCHQADTPIIEIVISGLNTSKVMCEQIWMLQLKLIEMKHFKGTSLEVFGRDKKTR